MLLAEKKQDGDKSPSQGRQLSIFNPKKISFTLIHLTVQRFLMVLIQDKRPASHHQCVSNSVETALSSSCAQTASINQQFSQFTVALTSTPIQHHWDELYCRQIPAARLQNKYMPIQLYRI